MTHAPSPFFDPRNTPGQSSARVQTTPNLEQGRRYQSQNARKVVPGPGLAGTKRSSLPKLILKGCPHCHGDVSLQHEVWDYGDYACTQCGRAWDVELVTKGEGGRLHLKLGKVGHYLEQKPPKRRSKRAKYDYD